MSDITTHEGKKYLKQINDAKHNVTIDVDVYCVLEAFGVTCPARAHAIKKLLCCGTRGKGDAIADLKGVLAAGNRALELEMIRQGIDMVPAEKVCVPTPQERASKTIAMVEGAHERAVDSKLVFKSLFCDDDVRLEDDKSEWIEKDNVLEALNAMFTKLAEQATELQQYDALATAAENLSEADLRQIMETHINREVEDAGAMVEAEPAERPEPECVSVTFCDVREDEQFKHKGLWYGKEEGVDYNAVLVDDPTNMTETLGLHPNDLVAITKECYAARATKRVNDYLTEEVTFEQAPYTAEFLLDGVRHAKAHPNAITESKSSKWNALVLGGKRVMILPASTVLISKAMKEKISE